MARVPPRFVDETLWLEFKELNRVLRQYLADVTERVIATALETDSSEVEERRGPESLPESISSALES